jgi:hypothetical protein
VSQTLPGILPPPRWLLEESDQSDKSLISRIVAGGSTTVRSNSVTVVAA